MTKPVSKTPVKRAPRKAVPSKPTNVIALAKAVERGELPSGSVVVKVTGERSMATPGAAKKAPAKVATTKPEPAVKRVASFDAKVLPTNPVELRRMIKSARSTRWAAEKAHNDARVTELGKRLDVLRTALAKAVAHTS